GTLSPRPAREGGGRAPAEELPPGPPRPEGGRAPLRVAATRASVQRHELAAGLPAVARLADDLVVERIPLDRHSARFLNQPLQIRHTQRLRRVAAGRVVDRLVHHRPVDVVRPPALGYL